MVAGPSTMHMAVPVDSNTSCPLLGLLERLGGETGLGDVGGGRDDVLDFAARAVEQRVVDGHVPILAVPGAPDGLVRQPTSSPAARLFAIERASLASAGPSMMSQGRLPLTSSNEYPVTFSAGPLKSTMRDCFSRTTTSTLAVSSTLEMKSRSFCWATPRACAR